MKFPNMHMVVLCITALTLTGCGRILDWTKDSFYQGQDMAQNKLPRTYTRSIVVYDQFETVGMFDALWLSDEVRMAYTDVWALKFGKNEERKQAFLRRQLEENRHFIMFYVLSLQNIIINDARGDWSVFLQIDDQNYTPIELTVLEELDFIYKSFFGPRCNRFKDVYLVKFDARDADENPIITETTKAIRLFFRSTKKQALLEWDLVPRATPQVPAC
ncbi:MAG TPA: hypothetical protein VLG71_03110 [Candidatus Limnocylindria bacterium]|nr:hypothetical protein [Candidatus Limnocylindria bacterium]